MNIFATCGKRKAGSKKKVGKVEDLSFVIFPLGLRQCPFTVIAVGIVPEAFEHKWLQIAVTRQGF